MSSPTTPLTFRTDVRGSLYLASAALAFLGLVFTGYFVTTPDAGFTGILAATLGVFMLYVAWVNVWVTRAGYPHLTLIGSTATSKGNVVSTYGLKM